MFEKHLLVRDSCTTHHDPHCVIGYFSVGTTGSFKSVRGMRAMDLSTRPTSVSPLLGLTALNLCDKERLMCYKQQCCLIFLHLFGMHEGGSSIIRLSQGIQTRH